MSRRRKFAIAFLVLSASCSAYDDQMEKLTEIELSVIPSHFDKAGLLCAVPNIRAKANDISRILATITKPGLSNNLGQTPASFAVMADDPIQLDRLLSLGYKTSDRDGSLLHGAAYWNSTRVARFLLAHGADPNQANAGGATPLMVAVSEGGPDVAKLLLTHGASVDSRTVRYTLPCKDQGMVNLLMSTGVRIDPQTQAAAVRMHMQLHGGGL